MDRRTALFSTLLLGGLAPRALRAQIQPRPRRAAGTPAPEPPPRDDLETDAPPADVPIEPGHEWKSWPLGRYTSLPHFHRDPQSAVVEWIFRRTESSVWHGDKVAVLSASRTRLLAYHDPRVLRQVAAMVERFTDAQADLLAVRVRFIAAPDPRWRYAVYRALNLLQTGPQGQQVWTLKAEEAALVLTQLQMQYSALTLFDKKVELINGQTLTIETTKAQNHVAGLRREGAAGLGFQPDVKPLNEGVILRFSPLLTYEGDALEAAVDLQANTIRSLHRTRVIAPREIGPPEMTIDVPEVTETRFNRTVEGWKLGHTLLISAGIQPGILQSKTGFMNLRIPGTVPTTTELLAFVEVDAAGPPPRTARRGE